MYMIYFILHDAAHLDDVLKGWQAIGVSGVTISESSGAYQRQVAALGARYLFGRSGARTERFSFTLVTIVPDEEVVQRCIAAAEAVVGNLDDPNTGVLAAWKLDIVRGVPPTLRNNAAQKGPAQ